jgi:pimeloyl-ACP methyl ester carboxylesterase
MHTNSQASDITLPKRGFLFQLRRLLIGLGIGIVLLILLGGSYQVIASEFDRRNLAAPGPFIDINGHRIHLYCTGEGSPTVILEAGAFSFSSEWYWVQQQLSATQRVCSYDRAGNGWSEPVSGSRDGLTLAAELHTLLQQADVPAPYILVGHSLGGILSAIYASQYPDQVVGLVLVDSAVPLTWPDISGYEQYKADNESVYGLMTALTRLGLTRLIVSGELNSFGYPSAIVTELTAFKATIQGVDVWDTEVRQAQWELGKQLQAASDLGSLPVVITWASYPEITSAEDRLRVEAIRDMLPDFSSNSIVLQVEGANHGSIIGNEHYAQQVSDAVLDVIQAGQSGMLLDEDV